MNEHTFNKRLHQLVTLINLSQHREELLKLMLEQVVDDTEMCCTTK